MDESRHGPDRSVLLTGAAVAAAAALAYANSFRVPFLLDDGSWRGDPWSSAGGAAGRPLLALSLALNRAWSGDKVWSYHALNLAIHILAGLTLMGVVRRTLLRARFAGRFRAPPLALAGLVAGLWTLHPVQTEAVTYLSQRAESLMGLFYLLTLYCFIRSAESDAPAPVWAGLSVLACYAGMATKEVMVTAPVLVLIFDWALVSGTLRRAFRRRRGYYLGLASAWIFLAALLRSAPLGDRGVGLNGGVSRYVYLLTELRVVAQYLRLTAWPHPLVFDYGREVLVSGIGQAAPSALFLFAVAAACAVLLTRGYRGAGLCLAAFFLLLLPSSSVVPIADQPMAESRLYLPLAPIVALVVFTVDAAADRRALALLAVLAVGLIDLTWRRDAVYASARSLWEDTIAKRPHSSRAHYNLAVALAALPGRVPDAIREFEEAIRLRPDLARAHSALAEQLAKAGRRSEAVAHYEEAVRINPDYAEAQNNLAAELAAMPGHMSAALYHYEQALRANPDFAAAHYNFGKALAGIPGRLPEAIAQYEWALRENPGLAEAHNGLANALLAQPGRRAEAVSHYEEALRLNPNFAEAHNNFGNALRQDGNGLSRAIAQYRAALRADPAHLAADFNLASALLELPDGLPEAIAEYETVLRLQPNSAEAENNLGVALVRAGRAGEALIHFQRAVRFDPGYLQAKENLRNALLADPSQAP